MFVATGNTEISTGEADRLQWMEAVRGGTKIALGLKEQLDDMDITSIVDRLTGDYTRDEHISEGRSTLIPSRSGLRYDGIKVKGTGLLGGLVDFDRSHDRIYDLPRYDFEGNYAPDPARAFQTARAGGMSYQQAVNEFRVSGYLVNSGFDTYPPIGYGCQRTEGITSWFCLLNAPFQQHWQWNDPEYDRGLVDQIPRFAARSQMKLKDLGLLLVLHGVANIGGRLIRKDFHSARFMSWNDSFISRICYYFFDINFVLYTLVHPVFETGISEWAKKSWCDYVDELCDESPDFDAIKVFKNTLVKLKLSNDATLEQRMDIIRGDPVASLLCREFMTSYEQRWFL